MSRLLPIRRRPYTTAIRDCGVQLKWFSRSNSFFRPMKSMLRQYRPIFDYNPAYSDFTGGYGPDSPKLDLVLERELDVPVKLVWSLDHAPAPARMVRTKTVGGLHQGRACAAHNHTMSPSFAPLKLLLIFKVLEHRLTDDLKPSASRTSRSSSGLSVENQSTPGAGLGFAVGLGSTGRRRRTAAASTFPASRSVAAQTSSAARNLRPCKAGRCRRAQRVPGVRVR